MLFFSCSVVSNSLWPYGLQHTRIPCPSLSPGVCSNLCPLIQWCHPTISLPSIFPSIRVFSNELALRVGWPKCWSFSFSLSPSNEYSGLISFRIDSLGSLLSKGLSRVFSKTISCLLLESPALFFSHLVDDLHAYLETSRHRENGQAPLHSSHGHAHHLPLCCPTPTRSFPLVTKETWLWSWWGLSKEWENNDSLRQQSPNFLAPGTDFMKDNFSTGMGGDRFRMIQGRYIYCALYVYSMRYLSAPRGWGPRPWFKGISSQILMEPQRCLSRSHRHSCSVTSPGATLLWGPHQHQEQIMHIITELHFLFRKTVPPGINPNSTAHPQSALKAFLW